ncbi:MAG: DUF1870 family protein [Endozoicomonadaceae bacterium]|nr:DUF1870 family protein [Endozoicomonadaceae bacterium]
MYGLVSQRNQVIDNVCKALEGADIGAIRWYQTFEQFTTHFPNGNKVLWRLHQSVCAYFFTEGGDVRLRGEGEADKNLYLYQWFAGETAEQIEYAKQEAVAKEKGLID